MKRLHVFGRHGRTPRRAAALATSPHVKLAGACFSPDENELAFASDAGGTFNVYTVRVATGVVRRRTESVVALMPLSYFPDGSRMLLRRTADADANEQLCALSGRSSRVISPAGAHSEFLRWASDGRGFFILTNARDRSVFDLRLVDARTYEMTSVLRDVDVSPSIALVTPDGSTVAVRRKSSRGREVAIIDTATRKRQIVASSESAYLLPQCFDPTGRYLYYITDEDEEFRYVCRYDRVLGQTEVWEKRPWDVVCTTISAKGTYATTLLNSDAQRSVSIRRVSGGGELLLPSPNWGAPVAAEFSASERHVAVYNRGDWHPASLCIYRLDGRSFRPLVSVPEARPRQPPFAFNVVRFRSFDGLEIPSLFYRPAETLTERAPAIVWVHGGPGGQAQRDYNPLFNRLLASGFAVLAVNYRGSSGYGKTFSAADRGTHGREPLWDCIEAKKFLETIPGIDGTRVAIVGESYGGFIALAALAFFPDTFAAGVDFFGIADWLHVLQSIPDHWGAVREALFDRIGDPARDADPLRDMSPLFAASRVRKPLFVVQGGRDVRVQRAQAEAMVDAVRRSGVPVEYVVYEDEGHGLLNAKNRDDLNRRTVSFLLRHLCAGSG